MNELIDIRTLSFVSAIISLVLSVCMVYIYTTRKTYDGFKYWMISSISYSLGMILMGFRGLLPDLLTIVLANTLLVTGFASIPHGLELFTNSLRRTWLLVSSVILMLLVFYIFTYMVPNVNARIAIASVMVTVLYGYAAYLVHRRVPTVIRGRNMFLLAVLGIQALWTTLRALHAIFVETGIQDYMHASAFYGVSVVIFFSGNIFVIIGLITLNFQKVEFDLRAALEEVKTLRGIIPICSSCKKIRDDEGSWSQIEAYIRSHSHAEFSHGLCPDCMHDLYPDIEAGEQG